MTNAAPLTLLRKSNRRRGGSSILELPILLFFVFIVIGVPLLGLATLAYRNALFAFALKNACAQASKAPSFTAAQELAAAKLADGCGGFTGIKITSCDATIISQRMNSGEEIESTKPLSAANIDPQRNLYFLQVKAKGLIAPVILMNEKPLWSVPVPGLTVPYPLDAACRLFVERPRGLSS
jgi:hypothetical protein